MKGIFDVEYFDDCNNLIAKFKAPNNFTEEGASQVLNAMFCATAAPAQWYVGIIGVCTLRERGGPDAGDQLINLQEFSPTNYVGWYEFPDLSGARIPFPASVASPSDVRIHNTSVLTFTLGSLPNFTDVDAEHRIQGFFVTNDGAYLGRNGVILTEATFNGWYTPQYSYTLRFNYTIVM